MSIDAKTVQKLREKTGAGMMDCKKALIQTEGDFEAAVDWLRTKGLAAAAKKSGKTASEGLVGIATSADGKKAAAVEVNSQTDFVARNEQFQSLVKNLTELAVNYDDEIEDFKKLKVNNSTVEEYIVENIATIGENIVLRRIARMSVDNGVVSTYMHNAVVPNYGKIAVMVALESNGDKEKLQQIGKQIAMHIAAAKPDALSIADVDSSALEREKNIFAEQAKASGKPESIIDKMVEGRVRKYYEEVVLLEQVFVIDGKSKISQVVEDAAKTVGAPVTLKSFVRFNLGEGIEQEESDFASEVANMARK
jgi:elongation factor Ts